MIGHWFTSRRSASSDPEQTLGGDIANGRTSPTSKLAAFLPGWIMEPIDLHNWVVEDLVRSRTAESETIRVSRVYARLENEPRKALAELIQTADEGSLIGMLYLGYAYQSGRGVPINFLTAEQWFRRAAQRGSMRAFIALGALYLHRRRYAEAQATFEAAAASNFVPAIHWLGRMYFYGEGVDKDFEKARSLLERASVSGNVAAKLQLAHLLKTGHFGLRQAIRARWLRLTGFFEGMSLYMKEPQSDRFL